MQVGKWGNSLAVRLPAAVVDALQLKEGDEIDIEIASERHFLVARDPRRQQALAKLHVLVRPLPLGFRFSRDEANRRARERDRSGVFFDSNVVLYTLVRDDPRATVACGQLLEGGTISVQVLNEVANVARRAPHPPVEDLHHGLVVDDRLVIQNPFRDVSTSPK